MTRLAAWIRTVQPFDAVCYLTGVALVVVAGSFINSWWTILVIMGAVLTTTAYGSHKRDAEKDEPQPQVVINVSGASVDKREAAQTIIKALQEYKRGNGGRPLGID